MIFRSLFIYTLIIILFIDTLNAINSVYLGENSHDELADTSIKDIDDELETSIIKQNDNNEDDLIKRNKYPSFYLSPLWLSRRTRTNRLYGKPLWISKSGR